jgi:hypothetical protein
VNKELVSDSEDTPAVKYTDLVSRLVNRLEHLSVDSAYAHRASGLRGSLLRYLSRLETGKKLEGEEQVQLDELIYSGYKIIELAAKEIGAKR